MTHLSAARALLESAVDYAGTFAPARLGLEQAMANYARDRAGAHAWMLGRFLTAGATLQTFERLASRFAADAIETPWELSLILSREPWVELEFAHGFNERWRGRMTVVAVEFPPLEASAIRSAAAQVPRNLDAYFEIPVADPGARVEAVAASGASAKVRTGGITADAFPSAKDLLAFIRMAADLQVAFKATAGLHHALRGRYALTYEDESPTAVMHGFLNVSVAAALVHLRNIDATEALDVLNEPSAAPFGFTPHGLVWRDRFIPVSELAETRRRFFRSFGSRAFREPVEELERLHVL